MNKIPIQVIQFHLSFQAFQESFNSFLELTADDKTTDESSGDQNVSGNGQLDAEVAELVQLQRQLNKNSNQLTRMNQRLKSTAGICEREIKEIKTFLLCLDRRNTDLMKKTTKMKTELYEKVKNLEDDVRFIKMDQKVGSSSLCFLYNTTRRPSQNNKNTLKLNHLRCVVSNLDQIEGCKKTGP